jgi:hypothetical protein
MGVVMRRTYLVPNTEGRTRRPNICSASLSSMGTNQGVCSSLKRTVHTLFSSRSVSLSLACRFILHRQFEEKLGRRWASWTVEYSHFKWNDETLVPLTYDPIFVISLLSRWLAVWPNSWASPTTDGNAIRSVLREKEAVLIYPNIHQKPPSAVMLRRIMGVLHPRKVCELTSLV